MSPELPQEVLKAFEKAAEVARKRTRHDRDRASTEDTRRVLQAIEDGMFNPNLSLSTPRPSAATFAWFAKQRQTTPSGYLVVRRIEVALLMIDHTEIEISTIAQLVGYRYPQSFTKAFTKIMGYAPTEERHRWVEGQIDDPTYSPPPENQRSKPGTDDLRRTLAPFERAALAGTLARSDAARYVGIVRFLRTSWSWSRELLDKSLTAKSLDPGAMPEDLSPTGSAKNVALDAELKLLAEADHGVLEMLSLFDKGTPAPVQPILAELHAHLSDPDYSLKQLKYDLFADNSELARFSRLLGIPPWQYLLEARLEKAARLLRDSPLSVPVITEHTGYADPPQFRRAFKKWMAGLTPMEYRARARHTAEQFGPPRPEWFHWRFLDQMRKTERGDGLAFLEYLEKVYRLSPPQKGTRGSCGGITIRQGERLELVEIPKLL